MSNMAFCRDFASNRKLLKAFAPPLQGGGRWFKSSIAHLEKAVIFAEAVRPEARPLADE